MSPQETEPDFCVCVQESLAEACVDSVLLRGQDAEYSGVCKSHFEGSCHYLHYPYHILASGQTTGKEHSPAHQQKIGLKIY